MKGDEAFERFGPTIVAWVGRLLVSGNPAGEVGVEVFSWHIILK
jgi:hypothetical protein